MSEIENIGMDSCHAEAMVIAWGLLGKCDDCLRGQRVRFCFMRQCLWIPKSDPKDVALSNRDLVAEGCSNYRNNGHCFHCFPEVVICDGKQHQKILVNYALKDYNKR